MSEAKARLSEVLSRARRTAQVIESRGEAVAVVVSKQEYDRLHGLEAAPRATALSDLLDWTEKLKAEGPLDVEAPPRELEPVRRSPFADEE